MLFLFQPSKERVQTLIATQQHESFSYPNVGASRGEFPSGYTSLHGRIELGRGQEVYSRAQQALHNWKMFEVPSVVLHEPHAPIKTDTVVAVAVKHFGFWSLNFCKVVYVIDESGPLFRCGFAYGTLSEHFEKGEERFMIEWDRTSDLVSYEIASFSKPGKLATWLFQPLARKMQKRFLQSSLQAMKRSISFY